jgi:hypothetical protein
MKILASTTLAIALLGSSAFADAGNHALQMSMVSTYKPMAGFIQVVGDTRFVGYFLAGPDRCDVTVLQARADDEALAAAPRRTEISIAAGGRSELDAGPNSALAIACTIDADAIKVAPQVGRLNHYARLD